MLSGSGSTLIAEWAAALSTEETVEEILKRVAILIAWGNCASTASWSYRFWRRFGVDVHDAGLKLFGNLAKGVRELLRRRNLQLRRIGAVNGFGGPFYAALNDSTNKNADK